MFFFFIFVSSLMLLIPALVHSAALENPGKGLSYSGIGVISGWKCEAEGALTVVFNGDGTHLPLLYGSERSDVRDAGACDSADVGFVTLWNWAELGEGEHTAVAYDNGVEFARSTFTVASLGEAFVRGASGECTIEDFPSTGESATFTWNQNTQHLELIPESPSGLAPADQAAFDRLVVGKRVVSVDDARYYMDFPSAGRFRFVEYEPGERHPGSYRYRRTGSSTGTLTQNYDDGDVCTVQFTFTSSTTITARYTCDDGEQGGGNWRLIDSPSSGGDGPVNDGWCRAGLVVDPGESCMHPTNDGTFSVDSSGRGSFTVGGFTSQSGGSIQMRNTTINGQTITFVARRNSGSNSWTIDEVR